MADAGSLLVDSQDSFWDALEHVDDGVVDAFANIHEAFGEVKLDAHAETPVDPYEKFDIGEVDWRLFKRVWGASKLLPKDKLSFLFGSSQLWICAYWLGCAPQTFYQLYSAECLLLFGVRLADYWFKKWHYYLFDFCYYANVLLLCHIWVLPKWKLLTKVTFAFNTGPLAWSVLAFRNSLVYHDLDKVTSLYLHFVPALVSWTMRWYHDDARFGPLEAQGGAAGTAAAAVDSNSSTHLSTAFGPRPRHPYAPASTAELLAWPLLFYTAWAVAYYLKLFVVSAAKIKAQGYQTLFTYVTSRHKGTFHNIAKRIPQPWQPAAYLLLHCVFCLTTWSLAILCWRSWLTHTALLVAAASLSIWHGANYYFEVFATRYSKSLGQALADASGSCAVSPLSSPVRGHSSAQHTAVGTAGLPATKKGR